MNVVTDRAWRFIHPTLDDPEIAPGLRLSPTGAPEMAQGHAAIRQSILMLISTRPGERVMRPAYGCELTHLVFSPNDATTAGLAIHAIRQAITRFEPRVKIMRLTADRVEESPDQLRIMLEYRVRGSPESGSISLDLDLSGNTAA